jgi:hypothetical protein
MWIVTRDAMPAAFAESSYCAERAAEYARRAEQGSRGHFPEIGTKLA